MSGFYLEDLDDVREPEPVEDGVYEVEISSAQLVSADSGSRFSIQALILNPPEDNPNPPALRPALFLPRKDSEEWQINNSKLTLKRFFTLFGITPPGKDISEAEEEDWIASWTGKRAKVKVKKTYNKVTERFENTMVIPPLPAAGKKGESGGGEGGGGGKKGLRAV